MTRTLTAKGQQTRDRIVEVAARLMHVQGLSETSLEDILEVAGAGKGQFYHYFADRSDLEAAVLSFHVDQQPEAVAPGQILRSWQDVEAWFDSAYRLYEMTNFEGGCPLGSMASEVADRDDGLRSQLDAAFAVKRDHLARGLAELQRTEVLQSDADVAGLAEFVIASIQGGILLARVRRDGAPLRTAMDHALARVASFRVSP
ncbi:MAG: TetR family transcriptional regulator C-terminal domain-containing protein [Gemmatimonadota bacterium]